MSNPRQLTRSMQWWAPDYEDIKESGVLQKDAVVRIINDVFEPWKDNPGGGHTYWHLEWHESGKKHRGWTRTYADKDESSFSVPLDEG